MRYALVSLLALLAGCGRTVAPVNEVVAFPGSDRLLNPADAGWDRIPEHVAKLMPQDLVEPRLLQPSTQEVRVQTVTFGSEIAFRLRWIDKEVNDAPGPTAFLDGCAVQIPVRIEANPPDPQMGQPGHPVDIVFWRADWQASVKGRPDTIQGLYPNAQVDHYPFQAKSLAPGSPQQQEMARRYAPAAAVGNRRVGPRESPVELLTAEGPGTLVPGQGVAKGQGIRSPDGWTVVISRKRPEGLAPKVRSQVAFAVWEGSAREVGARKMRTGWIPLAVREGK